MQRLLDALADFVVDRPRTTWALLLLICVPAAFGWAGVRLLERPEPSWTTPEEDRLLYEVDSTFQFPGWPTVLVLESEDFFRPDTLRAVRRMVDGLETSGLVESVTWIDDVPPVGGIGRLLPGENASAEELAAARAACLEHPLVADQLLSPDGRTMIVRFLPGPFAWEDLEAISRAANTALEGSDVRARVTGSWALEHARRSAFGRDHLRVQGTAYALVLVLALLVFRGPTAMLVAASGPFLAGFLVQGWLWFLGEPRNELTDVILPVLVVMIGFTDAVHLVVHMRRDVRSGLEPREAARQAIRHVGLACLWTSLTTAIGFASLVLARSEVVQGFGRASAIGVLVAFVAVLVLIPLVGSTRIGRRMAAGSERDLVQRNMHRLNWVIEGAIRRPRLVSLAGIGITLALAAVALRLEPDDRLAHRVPHGSEAYRAMQHCERSFGGTEWISVVVAWNESTGDEAIWSSLGEIETLVSDEPLLRGPLSIRHVLAVTPGEAGPAKLDLVRFVPEEVRRWFWQPEARRALVAARVRDLGVARYEPVLEALRERLRAVERRQGVTISLSGRPIIVGTAVRRVVLDLLDSLAMAALLVFAVMAVALRSLRLGLVSVVPNVFPLAATAAVRVAIDSSLDVASACSFVICLGIAVDDTIHYLVRYRRERAEGAHRDEALRRAFTAVGGALVMTTLVLVAGFGSVLASSLPTHRLFAAMAASTVAAALIGDLVLLPALLAWTEPEAPAEPTEPTEPT